MVRSRIYTSEFKSEAVKLAKTSDKSYNQTARDLGVPSTSLHAWIKQSESEGSAEGIDLAELKLLRKENHILKEERDILKKALAIFSKAK